MQDAVLLLDIGGTKVAGGIAHYSAGSGVAEAKPTITSLQKIPTHASRGGADVAARIATFAASQIAAARDQGLAITGIGVASAGVVDPHARRITYANELMPGWTGTELGKILHQATSLPVEMLNDVHAHALGEATWGAGKNNTSALVVAVGTGIGGGFVHRPNGAPEVLFGGHNVAGHVGHFPHPLAAPFDCSCGRRGHVESVAAGTGLTRLYNHLLTSAGPQAGSLPRATNGAEVSGFAAAGNAVARQALSQAGRALGETLGALANSVDPAVIILSGSMTHAGEQWWDGVQHGYRAQAMDPLLETPVVLGSLGSQAPLLGALSHLINHT